MYPVVLREGRCCLGCPSVPSEAGPTITSRTRCPISTATLSRFAHFIVDTTGSSFVGLCDTHPDSPPTSFDCQKLSVAWRPTASNEPHCRAFHGFRALYLSGTRKSHLTSCSDSSPDRMEIPATRIRRACERTTEAELPLDLPPTGSEMDGQRLRAGG